MKNASKDQMIRKMFAGILLGLPLAAAAQDPQPQDNGPVISKIDVRRILVPVTVTTKSGKTVNNLQPSDFRVYDNGKQAEGISLDVAFHPVSIVVCIQANSDVEGILPKIQKTGSLLESIVGESGEVALLAFDHRVRPLQEFTQDTNKITEAIKKIKPGSSQSFLNDTILTATQMLKGRAKDRRKIILVFTQTRDKGSSSRIREVLTETQFADVVIYSIDISRALSAWTRRTDPTPPRPSAVPPEAGHAGMVGGGASTPTTQMQNMGSGNAIPAFVEIFKQVKGVFVDNPPEAYTKWTGGREYDFASQVSLERAIADMGEEIRSQYLVTYRAPNDGGYHEIRVDVMGLGADLKVRAKKGYYLGGPKAE